MPQPTQNLVGVLLQNYDGTFNSRYPTGNKPVKRYINLTGSGFGGAPTKAVYQDWRYEIAGQRAVKGLWDSALYGATSDESYPLFQSLGGVVGIANRDNLNIDYDITAVDSTDYKITISGTQYSINSGASSTQTSITTALKAVINADSGCPAVAGGTTYLSLTRKNSAVPFSIIALSATSTSSVTVGTGVKSFTLVELGKTFSVGQTVNILSVVSQSNSMSGTIATYDSGTGAMTVTVTSSGGSGTYTSWTISGATTTGASAGAGINIISRNNSITGFVKQFAPSPSYFAMWQAGTPDGYYFSGASEERAFDEVSSLKMGWVSDGGLDSKKKADLCSLTRVSSTGWMVAGNETNVGFSHGGAYSWNKPNSFFTYHKAGASPFVDAGTVISGIATDAGATTATRTSDALFRKLSTLTITAQNNAAYTVTVNGTPCTTFTSDADATTTEIQTGLISAINGSTSAVVASSLGNTVVCKAANGTNPTVTATANLLVEDSNPWFDQISTLWAGNHNQAHASIIYPMFSVWTGDNCGNQVLLADSATFTACTKFIALDTDLFSDTSIDAFYYDLQAIGMTHWIRLKDGVQAASGAL